ncbi:hypothetical protein ACLB2K_006017 [Fragaria x ananassa]
MDARVETVMSYLDLESNEVLTVGIWGMGGIGKTTLANEVYQKIHNRFHTSGFVRSVRKQLLVVELQELVCKSFFGDGHVDTVKRGSTWPRLSKKKVLLVLDDVDDLRQIEGLVPGGSAGVDNFWGPGSRLIITTRDRRTLTELGVLEDKIYEVEKLNEEEASQLLCQKAFKKVNPPKEFVELSKSFLKYACGLPLAHEVLGSHLSGRTADEWPEVLDRLDEDLDKDIFSVLQISFDGLHPTDKKIFLDIACFFHGEDDPRVEQILKGCGFSSRIGINILVNKCLVKVERGKLWMHDLLRCLGWHIVRRESPYPGKRSRLWLDDNEHKYETRRSWRIEDARNVLTQNTGTTAVESLFLSLPEKEVIHLNSDPFLTMSKLRLLKICNVNFQQDVPLLQYPSKDLRLLEWHECPLESLSAWFSSRLRLVEIKIPNSRIERLWDESVYQLNSLIHMDLSNCRCLTMTPDFSAVPSLETLILEGCTELSEVHRSTMRLQHLVLLNLKGCVSLEELPDIIVLPGQKKDIIGLRCLRTFVLSGCTNLRVFPLIADHMETLVELFLDGTAIRHLRGLSHVHLRGLTFLNLSGCKNLLELPFSIITDMTSLKFLYLSSCSSMMGFEALPERIGLLEHLEELDVCDTPTREVPESISSLKNLKLLCFHGCSGLRLRYHSRGLTSLTSLTTLNLGGCNLGDWDIDGITGNLSSLQSLDLSENSFSSIPESICQLPELREISLRGCTNLMSLPGDPPASVKNPPTTEKPRAQKIATAEKKVLVEIVKVAQKRGMKGFDGEWKQLLTSYDKNFGFSFSDPGKRSTDDVDCFSEKAQVWETKWKTGKLGIEDLDLFVDNSAETVNLFFLVDQIPS